MNTDTKLTKHQIRFAELVASGETQTEAYRQAYPNGRPNAATARREGHTMAKRPDIAALILELTVKAREKTAGKISHGLEEAVEEADVIYQLGKLQKNGSVMAQGTIIKNRLLGLFAEDRKNDRTPLSDMTDEQVEAVLIQAMSEMDPTELERLVSAAIEKAKKP